MGLQLIVQSEGAAPVVKLLGDAAESSEVFQIEGELWGISIPTRVVDELGEPVLRRRLSSLNVFDLYEGHWRYS
jgi:hypothetical protein